MTGSLELIVTPAVLPNLVSASLIVLLGCIALTRERVTRLNLSFFILTLSAGLWLAAVAIVMMAKSPADAITWSRIAYIGVCTLPAAILQFALGLVGEWRHHRPALAATWLSSFAFIGVFAFSSHFILGVYRYPWGHYPRLGLASAAFLLFLAAVVVAGMITLRDAARMELTEQQKRRSRSFLIAFGVGTFAMLDYLPSFGIAFYPIGSIVVLAAIVLLARAIWRFSFIDLTPSYLAERLIENVHGGVIVADTHGTIRVANAVAAELLGSPPDVLIGNTLGDKLRLSESQSYRRRSRSLKWRRPDGSSVELGVTATLLRDREQLPVGVLYVLHDLTERRRAERHEFAANHDALTGLPNRTYFAQRFEDIASDITSRGRTAAVLFVDLDGFKAINDEHGHPVGDRLLHLVASRLRNALREDDMLARHGGDEFVALVSLGDENDGTTVADKLVRILRAEPFTVDQLTLHVSASVGIAFMGRHGSEIEELIRAADAAMYREKRAKPATARPLQDRVGSSPLVVESRA